MTKQEFQKLVDDKLVVLDGAFGTELQKRGMPTGVCPEKWVVDNPDVLIEIQQNYVRAGSDILFTCSLGGNPVKLKEFGLENDTCTLNKKLAEISRKAGNKNTLIAGDISSTGKFIQPLGEVDFEQTVNIFKEQIKGLLDGGVDLFVIETIMDLQEARAALIAVKELCALPVMVSMTFTAEGVTLTGTDPVTALVTLQSLGADAVGANCSTGPQNMALVLSAIKPYATVPVFAKPNAGMPKLVSGKTVFDMTAEKFAEYIPDFIKAGVNLIGGCCGTGPDYITLITEQVKDIKPQPPVRRSISAVCSSKQTRLINQNDSLLIVGERINPTGKKNLQEELKQGIFTEVKMLAREQLEKGAGILDINVGMPGINEKEVMLQVLGTVQKITGLPLCIDSSDIDTIELALRNYPGRALINSISAEKHKLKNLLPVAARYGAMFILLPLNDELVPEKAEQRIRIVKEIYRKAEMLGFTKDDIIVDGLVMSVSSNPDAALETLKVIETCTDQGFKTIVGLSNVSFGLPAREKINAAFLSVAITRGLTLAIANPSHSLVIENKLALDVILNKDTNSKNFIAYYNESAQESIKAESPGKKEDADLLTLIYDCVVDGDKELINTYMERAVQNKFDPDKIINERLIPAIQKVGDLFDQKRFFLPQLIASAETMRKAFDFLTPYLKEEKTGKVKTKKSIILATVFGDVHDIGKNIVALMLKNYGFNVIDLGKNVPADEIIRKALETKADIIGLSALMTTTMPEMKNVIRLAKKKGVKASFMIGGAVVTEDYAREIGANYAKDSLSAVRLAEKI